MKTVWFVLAGVVGGVLGGMGFGGGTLLLPILTFFLKVPYKLAAWVNLIVFLPTAVVALVLHTKNKMVDWRAAGKLLFFAIVGLGLGFIAKGRVPECVLRRAFGISLIVVGSISIFFVLFGFFKKK
ncbi:MAG TPA: hypothetical protein DCG79_04670, partial [Clostridiales bacterium]|nr:hypothetical protein [Clostridiales bacterium]